MLRALYRTLFAAAFCGAAMTAPPASAVDPSLYELGNMIDVAQLIVSQSLQRKENKGGYYNVDHAKNHFLNMILKIIR